MILFKPDHFTEAPPINTAVGLVFQNEVDISIH